MAVGSAIASCDINLFHRRLFASRPYTLRNCKDRLRTAYTRACKRDSGSVGSVIFAPGSSSAAGILDALLLVDQVKLTLLLF
jgi:hypothetical protein